MAAAFTLVQARGQGQGLPPVDSFPLEAYAAVGARFAESSQFGRLGMTAEQFEAFLGGMRSVHRGQIPPSHAREQELYRVMGARLQQLAGEAQRNAFAQPGALKNYMKAAIRNFKLQRSDSGLGFAIAGASGTGRPAPEDKVVISCGVASHDGRTQVAALSFQEKQVAVADLVPGLAEGVQMLTPGATAILVVPPDLSYGSGEWPVGVTRGTPLIYTVKLHRIVVEKP